MGKKRNKIIRDLSEGAVLTWKTGHQVFIVPREADDDRAIVAHIGFVKPSESIIGTGEQEAFALSRDDARHIITALGKLAGFA